MKKVLPWLDEGRVHPELVLSRLKPGTFVSASDAVDGSLLGKRTAEAWPRRALTPERYVKPYVKRNKNDAAASERKANT